MKKIHHKCPKCPKCNSDKTGYYMYLTSMGDYNKIIASKMENGELVECKYGIREPGMPNLFCSECGTEWSGNIIVEFITKDVLSKYKEKYNFTPENIEYIENNKRHTRYERFNSLINYIFHKIKK